MQEKDPFCYCYTSMMSQTAKYVLRIININPLKSRDILDPINLPIKKSVEILAILYFGVVE